MIPKEVALAADIFMRLTLLKFLSMMCAVGLSVTTIKKAVELAPRREKHFKPMILQEPGQDRIAFQNTADDLRGCLYPRSEIYRKLWP